MTQHKDLKRLVRARMQKTGEAYTAARAQIVAKPRSRITAPGSPARPTGTRSQPAPSEYAAIAGMSDVKLKDATGCTWAKWVKALDHYKADQMSHGDIAKLIRAKYDTPSWWTQTVAVGYERIKGLRARGQQRDGTFGVTKSRTFAVPVLRLFEAWSEPAQRSAWLGTGTRVRTATAPKSLRLALGDGTIVAVGFTAKGRDRSVVAVEHAKLPDRAAADRVRIEWSERFDALARLLAPESP